MKRLWTGCLAGMAMATLDASVDVVKKMPKEVAEKFLEASGLT